MPPIQNPQHESFAQARAKGATLYDAFENAGYPPDRSHACRLASARMSPRGSHSCARSGIRPRTPSRR
jgi:hypothetical protein